MRKLRYTLALAFCMLTASAGYAYEVRLQSNCGDGLSYLAFYLGPKLYVEDSAIVKNGIAVFRQDKKLPSGIYSIVFPGKRLTADFLVDKSQNILIKADTANLVDMQIIGSPENTPFREYQKYMSKQGKFLMEERQAYMASKTKSDSTLHEEKYRKMSNELQAYREGLIAKDPKSMLAVLLQAMKEPEFPGKVAKTRQDSIDNFNYYKAHFWDGISFMDDRIVRTPFFQVKLENYYRNVIYNMPNDTIIKDIDYKLLLARTAPEMYKYLLNWLTDEYINPKYMGQDAVFVHLYNQYHSKGLTPWLSKKQHDAISNRAFMVMGNLVGEPAFNFEMLNQQDKLTYLNDLKADYTVLIFWDPNCGHCKTEVPRIDSMYRAAWKSHGVKMVAVKTESSKEEWTKFIKEHHLEDWVHLYESDAMAEMNKQAQRPGYKQLYDITMTPTIFLLDKDKRIMAKKLTFEQINDLLQLKWKKSN